MIVRNERPTPPPVVAESPRSKGAVTPAPKRPTVAVRTEPKEDRRRGPA